MNYMAMAGWKTEDMHSGIKGSQAGKVTPAVGTIMTLVPKLAGVINVVKSAFAALNATMLANPIVLIIAAVAALAAA